MKVACHAITWGRNLARALTEIRTLGFHGIETFGPTMYCSEAEYRTLVAASGLQLATIYSGGSFIYPEKTEIEIALIEKTIQLLASLGSTELVMGGGHKRPEGNTHRDYEYMARTLNHIGALAQKNGLRACFHPHAGTCVETGPQVDLLLELTDPRLLYFCPDVAHLALGGADPVAYIKKYLPRIGYVHLKDVGEDNRFVELGYGRLDLVGALQVLKQGHYDGWITVELDAINRIPSESAEVNLRFLEKAGDTLNILNGYS